MANESADAPESGQQASDPPQPASAPLHTDPPHTDPPHTSPLHAYPLLSEDLPRVDQYWIDARLLGQESGVAYLAHDDGDNATVLVMLAEGAAGDPAARDRFAGLVNKLHIDDVIARGGQGQHEGRLARKFRPTTDRPVSPDSTPDAPWVALAFDGSPHAIRVAQNMLDEVQLSMLPPQGQPSGPDYQHYWINRVKPGLARMWPLPWPGRTDRAGWVTILISWLLTLLLAALAILIAIIVFRNAPQQSPPPPSGQTSSPQSGSPQSGSPSPQSGSPSPQSGSPSPSGSEGSPSQSPSMSQSASPSGSESGGGEPTPSGSDVGSPSPRSKL